MPRRYSGGAFSFELGSVDSDYTHTLDLVLIPARAPRRPMKELVEAIAKALVDNPDRVQVLAIEGEQVTVFELSVHPNDLGQVIGHHGRIANAIRTILNAAGMKQRKRLVLEILE